MLSFDLVCSSWDVNIVWPWSDFLTFLASVGRASLRTSIDLYDGGMREQYATLFFFRFSSFPFILLFAEAKEKKTKTKTTVVVGGC